MSIAKFFDQKPALSIVLCTVGILFIGLCIFLFTKDNALNPNSITGIEALSHASASFWIWGLVLTIGITVIGIFAFRYFSNEDSTQFGFFWILFGAFMAVGWAKGCTIKTDTEKNKTTQGDGRVPAEDMLKK